MKKDLYRAIALTVLICLLSLTGSVVLASMKTGFTNTIDGSLVAVNKEVGGGGIFFMVPVAFSFKSYTLWKAVDVSEVPQP